MNTRPYHQNSDQREREAVLRNDTFQSRAQAEADDVRGRWAQEHKATVTGTGPVQYPRLPESSWVNDPVPPEQPLGLDINTVEAVGTIPEIQASIEELGDAATEAVRVGPQSASPLAAADVPSEVPASPADVERAAAIPTPKRRK